jgi:hypothetical protein
MGEIVESARQSAFVDETDAALERRILRAMFVVTALAVLTSVVIAPWRVTCGLLLGGILSFFNHNWMRSSLRVVFGNAPAGKRPKGIAARYVLRYFVIASAVASAYMFDLVSITGTLAGLCAFPAAIMIEAFVQLFFAIVRREET